VTFWVHRWLDGESRQAAISVDGEDERCYPLIRGNSRYILGVGEAPADKKDIRTKRPFVLVFASLNRSTLRGSILKVYVELSF